MKKRIDIRIEWHGSVALFFAESGAGRNWLRDHIERDAQRWAGAVVCEPRYLDDVIRGAREDGLEVT